MNETQRNIKRYQAALPGIRERIAATAMLLLVSLSMVVSASFAWYTISRAPEITGMTTNVAANGNLEIALVNPEGDEPGNTQIGDSFAADGQNIVSANQTWGNLVNLSDESYGLDNIVLRPALLSNSLNLLEQPLKGADFGSDGRVEAYYNEDFQFTNWVGPHNGLDGYFGYSDIPKYGVRAISTVQYTYQNNDQYYFSILLKEANGLRDKIGIAYDGLIGNKNHINVLADLIGTFMTDKMGDSNSNISSDIKNIYNLMVEFDGIIDGFGDAVVALTNLQIYNKFGSEGYESQIFYSWDALNNATAAELQEKGVNLQTLTDYKNLREDFDELLYGDRKFDPKNPTFDCIEDYYLYKQNDSSVAIYMKSLEPYINELVKISTCKIYADGTEYVVGKVGGSAALDIMGKNQVDAVIMEGLLMEFEKLTGCYMNAKQVAVSASYKGIPASITADTITTDAKRNQPSTFDKDTEKLKAASDSNLGDVVIVAKDTYGLAMDFWVRTNAKDSYLTLEGNVLTEPEEVRSTGVDMSGNIVELWTSNVTSKVVMEDTGETEEVTENVAVYQDENDVWRRADSHAPLYTQNESGEWVAPEGVTITQPRERFETIYNIIGYEGENRVWQDAQLLDTTSTTQGSGSCYVFYANDPSQQENCLRLLSNLRVAFIDSTEDSETYGKLIALGALDLENRFESSGRVTLPLVLMDDGSNYLTKDEKGELYVAELAQNVPVRITAVVFLDGRAMANADVLAADSIEGKLNIQFGSSAELNARENEDLELSTRTISVVASKTSGSFPGDNSAALQYTFDGSEPLKVYVRMRVNGEQPANAKAFFMRKVNNNQGSREKTFDLVDGGDGYWYGEYTFTAPGNYVLQTVLLDGLDYDLDTRTEEERKNPNSVPNYPKVEIEGFTIKSLNMTVNGEPVNGTQTIMTDKRYVNTDLSITLASSQKLPSDVKLQLQKDDGTMVTANMTSTTTGTWTGTANINTSGTYTLKYVIMDGNYDDLNENMQRTLVVYTGLRVSLDDGGAKYRSVTWENEHYSIPVYVKILDDTGAELKYMTGIKLTYLKNKSLVGALDDDLVWNGTSYEGELRVTGPGRYTFGSVSLGASNLTNTVTPPYEYSCISPDPAEYMDAEPMAGMDYLLSTAKNTITLGVRVANADGGVLSALLYDSDRKTEHWVKDITATGDAEVVNGQPCATFYIPVPADSITGFQSGNWTIQKLSLTSVYGAGSVLYDEENPMEVDLTESDDDLHVQIVNVKLGFTGTSETLGGANSDKKYSFMDSATTTKDMTIVVTDHKGNPLNTDYVDISDVKMTYVYTLGSSATYGGYTSDAENSLTDIVLEAASSDGKNFVMQKMTMAYAGKYVAKRMTATVKEKNSSISESFAYTSAEYKNANSSDMTAIWQAGLPVFELYTEKPTVKISSVSTNSSSDRYYKSSTPSSLDVITGSFNNRIDDYNAVVYMYMAPQGGTLDQEQVLIKYPTVTLSLAGVPATHSGVTMVFPSGNNTTSTFSFAAGKTTATGSVGAGTDGVYSEGFLGIGAKVEKWPVFYPAGIQTVDQITVVYNNNTYTVDLTKAVTINNPQYPAYADFKDIKSIEASFTGSTPSRIYGTPTADGKFVITLPGAQNWTEAKSETKNQDFEVQDGYPSTRNVYTQRSQSSGCSTTTYYQPYIETTTVSLASSYTTTWTRSWRIVGWKVGNTTYAPGATNVTISGGQTITAVLEYTDGTKTTTGSTTKRTVVQYTTNGAETTSKPSGTKIDSATNTTKDELI